MDTKKHENLLYKDLSYQIQGTAFEVRKNFGPGLKESIYQNAFAEELKSRNVRFEKEGSIQIFSPKTGKLLGSYRPDFIVDGKILVELKAVEKIPKMFIDQLYSYLRNSEYELGYFINFASPKLYVKRVIFTNDRKQFLQNTQKDTNMIRIVTKLSCLLVCFFVFFSVFASSTQAAEMFFVSSNQKPAVEGLFKVDLFLNTEEENINAVAGKVVFSSDLLELKEIRDGNSIINFWVDRPLVETLIITNSSTNRNESISVTSCLNSCGLVSFSGITPGGYKGEQGLLFSLIFRVLKSGPISLKLIDGQALLNDGKGTAAKLSSSTLVLSVGAKGSGEQSDFNLNDKTPPASFVPEIAQDNNIEGGKWFVVFATQDKESGIDHYEIRETRHKTERVTDADWIRAESPYFLKDQTLQSYVYIKAVDKAGNTTLAVINPKTLPFSYKKLLVYGILLVVIIILGLWRRRERKNLG